MGAVPLSSLPPAAELLPALLDLSLSGIVFYLPVLDEAGQVADFSFGYLNPAAQRLLQLPAQPPLTYRQQFPAGEWNFHRAAFLGQAPGPLPQLLAGGHYLLAARRVGEGLLVSFTEASKPAAEVPAPAPQAASLAWTPEQAPMAFALFQGPDLTVAYANSEMSLLLGRPVAELAGRSLAELAPNLSGYDLRKALTGTLVLGTPHHLREVPVRVPPAAGGSAVQAYFDLSCQPQRDAQGRRTGVVCLGVEVTSQVLARQQVQDLNEELAATNEELQASNEEYLLANTALLQAQQRLQQLNEQLQAARAEAEHQRGELARVFEQAPVAIAVYRGPTYTIELANPTVCRLWGRRAEDILGLGLFEALPEVAGLGYEQLLDGVLTTGQPVVVHGMEAQHDRNGQRETVYWDFVYEPLYEPDGRISGVMVVANEVTEQVVARRALEQLNQRLEVRVQERTRQLAEQQQLLGQILGQVPAAVATLHGPEHHFSFANDGYQALVGHRAVLGQPLAEALPELAGQGLTALLDQVYASGEPFVGQAMGVQLHDPLAPAPQQHYFDTVYQPLHDGQQAPVGILVFAVDVTGQVQARQQAEAMQAALLAAAQRRAEERQDLLNLFERAPVAVALLREPDHRLDYYNAEFEHLFPGAVRGRTVAEAYPQPTLPGFLAQLDQVYASGELLQGTEVQLLASELEAAPRFVTYTYQPYRELGHMAGVAVFAFDVTEQVLARRAVAREQDARQAELRRIFEQAPLAITILRGPQLVIELANAAICRLWGRRAEDILGRPHFEAMPETRGQGFEALLQGVLHAGQAQTIAEAPAQLDRFGTGQLVLAYVNFSFQPLLDEHGATVGIIAVGYEVTEQVLAREQVQGLNEELAAMNEELTATNEELHDTNLRLTRTNADLDTFVYTASHDLKAPITNVEGLLDALREYLPATPAEPMVPRLLGMMEDAVRRFQQTIGHLTDVVRLQQDAGEPLEEVDLATVVEAVRLDLAPLVETTRAQLLLDLDGCPRLRFAPRNLRSIVYNLLSNALKYRAPDRAPVVQLRCTCQPAQAQLEVQDNGLGLSQEQQSKLFKLFRRLHTHVEGTGVGLYMLKRIVDNAGGTIELSSQPGVGSTFTIILPRA